MRILGIDPGTIRMGFGAIDIDSGDASFVDCGVLQAVQRDPIEKRLVQIFDQLEVLIERVSPDVVAIEEPFVVQGPRKSALAVGEARAIALLAAAKRDLPIFQYTPTKVRQTVAGYGGGGKEQTQQMVSLLLDRPLDAFPLDASDALAVAICHSRHPDLLGFIEETATTKAGRSQ
jgi:crossover junction endodeoxyribonuclease RuvC